MHRKVERSVGIHDGVFHADEVTACALLLLFDLVDRDKIFRTRDSKVLEACEYVCDVGGEYDPERKLFDHHQSEYQGDFSSAGMMLQYLYDQTFLNYEDFVHLRDTLVHGIDLHDNGLIEDHLREIPTFSNVLSNYNPPEYDTNVQEQRAAFEEALTFVYGHLDRLLRRFRNQSSYRALVKETMDKYGECLVFEKPVPWLENFFELGGANHPAKFVMMPTGQGWKLRGVPPEHQEQMSVRVPLPEVWAGLLEEDLQKVTGISGAIFCHKGRFISIWKTREDVERALKMVLEYASKEERS